MVAELDRSDEGPRVFRWSRYRSYRAIVQGEKDALARLVMVGCPPELCVWIVRHLWDLVAEQRWPGLN